MQRHTLAVLSMAALIATAVAWNMVGAETLPITDEATSTPLVEIRVPPESKPVIVPSMRLWPHHPVSWPSEGGLLKQLNDEGHGLPSLVSLSPETPSAPALPVPAPANTPVAPVDDAGATLEGLSSAGTVNETDNLPPSSAPAKELSPTTDEHVEYAWERAKALRQASVRFHVPEGGTPTPANISPLSTSEETCVDVLLNPQLDVIEFGDGSGSIEHWSILYQKVYYDSEVYYSPSYSLVLMDENDGSDTVLDPFWETGKDYDMFGQGFWTPPNLTRIRVSFSSAYADIDAYDDAWSNLYTLTPEGYLDELVSFVEIPDDSVDFTNWYWELTSPEDSELLANLSGRLVAVAYDMLSDMEAPSEWLWLDDLQVTLCYERGQYGVYLPLVRKERPPSPQPACSPREPDSVAQRGSTTVDVTCGGSFSPVDQKDYYTLDLKGANRVRLRLFDLPPGTNWDALLYEDASGYPRPCYIGTPGDADKFVDCNLDPGKAYFVLVSRGPKTGGGAYKMRVERR